MEVPPVRALEFFSGIGGLHYGLEFAHPNASVIAAYDINANANVCYAHNFGIKPCQTGIQSLTAASLDKLNANCWLLSPPCQPYTQGGKSLDDKDPRAEGLLHLIKLLGELKQAPSYVFVENVPNFEVSNSRGLLVEKLDDLGYEINEFLVTPLQFGIANDRRRYYLTAHKSSSPPSPPTPSQQRYINRAVIHTTPWPPSLFPTQPPTASEPPVLSSYLEQNLEDDTPYRVPDKYILKRHQFRFDIVKPTETRCSCFTKAYGSHHVVGSGSFLQTTKFDQPYDFTNPSTLLSLGLRFFTPTEVARLHAFPIDNIGRGEYLGDVGHTKHGFSFPEELTLSQRWKLLGNSLNVRVVGVLMRDVLFGLRKGV
ncbi:C-5 cytosine-specific DNA methylase [Rhizophlyctis rosea]|nr:C-5 cytosine-specific DNA methylase [Rhizophlyctis rosea]